MKSLERSERRKAGTGARDAGRPGEKSAPGGGSAEEVGGRPGRSSPAQGGAGEYPGRYADQEKRDAALITLQQRHEEELKKLRSEKMTGEAALARVLIDGRGDP